ncbi:MAG: EamA family transporter [Saprospiraceae bacterium]|nr:EamA family transporter [Saprospiraceae bacterium]
MVFILLSIIFNTIIGLVFRYFGQFNVQNLPAIVVNYAVCGTIAAFAGGQFPWDLHAQAPPWLPFTLVLGTMFTFGFWVLSYTVQYHGVGTTSVFQKISLVITAVFAILYFNESLTVGKWIGIPLAVLAIVLIQQKSNKRVVNGKMGWLLLLPFLTFLFNGIIDTALFYVEQIQLASTADYFFISTVFYTAGSFGGLILIYQIAFRKLRVQLKDVLGGIALGIPNFFSIYFFLRALGAGIGGSVVVPVNNVGIILLSAVLGTFIFSERFNRYNKIGILAALLSIVLISLNEQ